MASRSYDQPDVYAPVLGHCTKISGSGSVPADENSQAVSRIVRGRYVGQTTPAYHRRLSEGGLLPLNAYYRWDYSEFRMARRYWGTNRGPNPKFSYLSTGPNSAILGMETGSFDGANTLLNRLTRNVNLVALQQKAYADIAPDLDLLTSMAEVGKTLGMILGVRKRALGLIRQALRGGFDTARAASSAWLEWRYGWRILGYDIQDLCEFWGRPFRGEVLQGFAGTELSEEAQYTSHPIGFYCQYDNVTDVVRTVNVKVRAAVKYTGRNANALVSPVNTGWEVIPFSFVADWFVSVGDVLSAWTVIGRADEHLSSAGFRLEETGSMVSKNPSLGSNSQAIAPFGVDGSTYAFGKLLARKPLGSLNLVPQLRVELTGARIADAVALLVGFHKSAGLKR